MPFSIVLYPVTQAVARRIPRKVRFLKWSKYFIFFRILNHPR